MPEQGEAAVEYHIKDGGKNRAEFFANGFQDADLTFGERVFEYSNKTIQHIITSFADSITNIFQICNRKETDMSEQEKTAMDRIAEIVPKLTKAQQEKLGYICEGIALACEKEQEYETAKAE